MLGYRIVCGLMGAAFTLFGLGSFVAFFRYHAPDGAPPAPFEIGPHGMYFVAFTGCALVAWGGALLGAARRPEGSRTLGTASAFALSLMALYRMIAWIVGDYAALGELLRGEAAVFLLLALALVWLRPPHPGPAAPGQRGL
jgi:hypothetical protein